MPSGLRQGMRPKIAVDCETEWRPLAACLNEPPDLFFPVNTADASQAKRICHECPVIEICLEFALVNHIMHGIWGGTSERERRRILRRRRELSARATVR